MDFPISEAQSGPVTLTPDIRERFQRHAVAWKEKSRHLSNTAQMALLRPY